MNKRMKFALTVFAAAMATHAAAQITFFENDGFQGRSFTTERQVNNFDRFGFNDRASSVEVIGNRWEVCDDIRFNGRCVVLRPGRYPSLGAMGLNDRVSSVRSIAQNARIDERRYAPAPVVVPVVPQITFFERDGFRGQSFTTDRPVGNFAQFGFNDRASSLTVVGGPWQICEDVRFNGRCVVLPPGKYPSLSSMGLNDRVSSGRAAQPVAPPVVGKVTLYERESFQGRFVTTDQPIENFERGGFNDRASSIEVVGGPWEACDSAQFSGRCAVLVPGRYPSLSAMGLNDRISSVRSVARSAPSNVAQYAPALQANPDFGRRNNERLYEARIESVHAVVDTPEQRCWIEHEQAAQTRSDANVPAAIAGAIIGGILGHQVGGGTGKDIATAGGAVAGAYIGSNVGRNGATQPAAINDVQRCESVPSQARAQYWDVTYHFRGIEHRVQMNTAPGINVTVNEQGEPRN